MNPYDNDPKFQKPDFSHDNPYGQNPYQQNPYQQPRSYKEPGSSGMAMASLILGVCSFIFMLSGFSPVIGGLGILLALLSRGCGKMSTTAKAGLIASCCGLIIGTAVMAAVTYVLVRDIFSQSYEDLLYQYYQEYYDEFEDSYPGIFDELPDGLDEFSPDGGYNDGNSFYFDDDWYDAAPPSAPSNGGLI